MALVRQKFYEAFGGEPLITFDPARGDIPLVKETNFRYSFKRLFFEIFLIKKYAPGMHNSYIEFIWRLCYVKLTIEFRKLKVKPIRTWTQINTFRIFQFSILPILRKFIHAAGYRFVRSENGRSALQARKGTAEELMYYLREIYKLVYINLGPSNLIEIFS